MSSSTTAGEFCFSSFTRCLVASAVSRFRSACLADDFGQMGGDHAYGLDHGVAQHLGPGPRRPGSIQTAGVPKAGSLVGDAVDLARGSDPNPSPAAGWGKTTPSAHRHVGHFDAILILVEPHVCREYGPWASECRSRQRRFCRTRCTPLQQQIATPRFGSAQAG